MIQKLTPRELNCLGLSGTRGRDWTQEGNTLELGVAGSVLHDNPGQLIDVARPGDTVLLWSDVQLNPKSTVALADAHPKLLAAGHCSFPRMLTDDFCGCVSVLFNCVLEINLAELPYLLKVVSLGSCKQ